MRRKVHASWAALVCAGALCFGCGEKPKPEAPTRPAVQPQPPRPSGPPKRLMPPEKKAEVDRVFRVNTPELEKCYSEYVGETGLTKLRGTIIIAVTIGWRRNPSKVWFLRNDFQKHPKLTRCFLDRVRGWEFPTWGGEMDYSFPRLRLEEM